MNLIVLKYTTGVNYYYDVNVAAGAKLTFAQRGTLGEGSFMIADINGVILLGDGSNASSLADDVFIYHMLNGEVRKSAPIKRKGLKLTQPVADKTAAAKVATVSAVPTTTRTAEYRETGIMLVDAHVDPSEPNYKRKYTYAVNADTNLTTAYAAIAAALLTDPSVASVVNTTGSMAITYKSGESVVGVGIGYAEGNKETVNTWMVIDERVTAAELNELAVKVSASEGAFDNHMSGSPDMFTKTYGIEAGQLYNVYAFTSYRESGYISGDNITIPAVVYVAIPDATALPVAAGSYVTMFAALPK